MMASWKKKKLCTTVVSPAINSALIFRLFKSTEHEALCFSQWNTSIVIITK